MKLHFHIAPTSLLFFTTDNGGRGSVPGGDNTNASCLLGARDKLFRALVLDRLRGNNLIID